MDFETFYKKRLECKEWMAANGFNEGDCEKNGEFKTIHSLRSYYDVFVDIGANNGIFIDKLNSVVAKEKQNNLAKSPEESPIYVLAFEPNPKLKEILERKIIRGKLVQSALSNSIGTSTFKVYTADDTTSSLLDRSDMMPHFTSAVTNIKIKTDTLDSYLPLIRGESNKGVFVKIDVEGVELPVLEGARALLTTLPKSFVMFEYSKAWKIGNHSLKDAFHLLDRFGFSIFRVTPLGLEALRFYTPEMDGPDYCNYFAVRGFDIKEILESKPIPSATHNWNDFYLFS